MTKVKTTTRHFVNEPSRRARTTGTVALRCLVEEVQKREIGERIRSLRERSRYKQPAVAERLGIGLRAYQKLEEVGTTRYERCEELAEIFGVDADWIWDGREKGPTPDPFSGDRLARIEAKLDRVLAALDPSPAELDAAVDEIERVADQASGPAHLEVAPAAAAKKSP